MEPWDHHVLERDGARLTITSVPGDHSPRLARRLMPPVMGSVLELLGAGAEPLRVYVTGDTLFRPWLRDVVERCGPMDAMVTHLGGTRALGLLVTMDHRQGADLVDLIRPGVTVPIHHDDYTVFRSPLADFERAWQERGLPGRLRVVARGERVPLAAADG